MILEILSSSAMGTALGGLFSFLSRMEERKALAVKNEHERGMLTLQMQADAEKARAMLEITKTQGELSAFAESQKAGLVQSGIKVVDAIVGIMRPALTFMLFVATCWIIWQLSKRVGGVEGMSDGDAVELYKHSVYETFFLSSTAVAWWFGARGSSARGRR